MTYVEWHPHPEVWLIILGAVTAYFWAVRRLGPRYVSPGDPPATSKEKSMFGAGVLVLLIGAEWPIHEISEKYLFSVHMLQHMLFSLVAPPLLMLGTPGWMARLILPQRLVGAARLVTRPIPALLLFNGYLVFSHWPGFVNGTVSNDGLHFVAHFVLFATSLIMWAPVFSPLPEIPRISSPAQMLYLFGQTIVPTVPASFLTFAERPFYRAYAEAPRLVAAISAVDDQRIAGLVMKLGGGLLLWGIIAVLFFRWSSREEHGTPDATDWQDLERKINRARPISR